MTIRVVMGVVTLAFFGFAAIRALRVWIVLRQGPSRIRDGAAIVELVERRRDLVP